MIPGLIDNHAHWVRAAEHDELRFDGVTSRATRAAAPGRAGAHRQAGRMDRGARRLVGGAVHRRSARLPARRSSTASLPTIRWRSRRSITTPISIASALRPPRSTLRRPIRRAARSRRTQAASRPGSCAAPAASPSWRQGSPIDTKEAWLANTRKLVSYLNSLGLTAWLDAGGRGMGAQHYEPYKQLADRGELNIRVFWTTIRQPATPAQVDAVIAEIPQQKPFQGNDYFDNVGWGESVYAPRDHAAPAPREQHQARGHGADARASLVALAERGLYVNSHVEMQRRDRRLPRRLREHQQGTPDQGAALVVLASRPGHARRSSSA